jgi:hypothetical protein
MDRHIWKLRWILLTGLSATSSPVALLSQTHALVPYFGGGLVLQRRTASGSENAMGPTALIGLGRRLTPALRLRADLRYSFDQSQRSVAASPCPGLCPASGRPESSILSLAAGVDFFPSGTGRGLFLRASTGLHHVAEAPAGETGIRPSLGAGLGLRLPLGPRGALTLEARLDRLVGGGTGPRELWPVLLSLEL